MMPIQHIFPLFVVLYGLFQSFLSVGPGNCNFLVSSESFPTPLRGHFLGFAAAIGKAGAAIGTTVLSSVLDDFPTKTKGQQVIFLIGSGISVVGILCVRFLIPNVSSLWYDLDACLVLTEMQHNEDLETEDAKFRAYLEANGYDTAEVGI